MRAAFATSGIKGFERKEIELWESHPASLHFSSIFIAMNYALLGKKAEALAWLERARLDRHAWLTELNADPVWDSLRDDKQFARLVEQVNGAR